jgi:hypothetical protein
MVDSLSRRATLTPFPLPGRERESREYVTEVAKCSTEPEGGEVALAGGVAVSPADRDLAVASGRDAGAGQVRPQARTRPGTTRNMTRLDGIARPPHRRSRSGRYFA